MAVNREMPSSYQRSLLHKLEDGFNIDVDSIDPSAAKAMPFKPHNQTSNQFIVGQALSRPENQDLILETVKEFEARGWEYVLDRISVRLCRQNIPNLLDRVLLQTSPRFAYDTQATIDHARRFASMFEEEGIDRTRFCLKIPTTGPGMAASKVLNEEGIRTLGTMVFCLPQAVGASQARCLYISPYYNELAALLDKNLHVEYQDTATQHPMSYRVRQMIETYAKLARDTGKEQPGIIVAAMTTVKEVVAVAELQAFGVTLFPDLLVELAQTKDESLPPSVARGEYSYLDLGPTPKRLVGLCQSDPLGNQPSDTPRDYTEVDFLASDGRALDQAIEEDEASRKRLEYAIKFFIDAEERAKAIIEGLMQT